MSLRLSGSLLLLLGCGGFGFSAANLMKDRLQAMYDFIHLLELMKSELSYRRTPLPALFRNLAVRFNRFKEIANGFADCMEGQVSPNLRACMQIATGRQKGKGLADEYFLLLADSLGNFDLEGQLKELDMLQGQIQKKITEMEREQTSKMRLCRTLGLCAGAGMAILLF